MPKSFVAARTEKPSTNIAEYLIRSTSTVLEAIFSESGNVGGSIGLLENGSCAFFNIGTRAVDDGQPPTEDTAYLISSITKPFLGLAIALLVNDGRHSISFETPVKQVLPELEGRTTVVSDQTDNELRISHLLAHRSEFMKFTNLWESPDGIVPWTSIDPVLTLLRHMPLSNKYAAGSFDNTRNYSNECFALLAEIIARTAGIEWGQFVTERILHPLHMTNTFTGVTKEQLQGRNNFASPHTVKVDGLIPGGHQQPGVQSRHCTKNPKAEPTMIQPSQASFAGPGYEQTPIGAAAGMMSSTGDLLKFYGHFLTVFHKISSNTMCLGHDTSEVEHGMVTWWKHILSRTEEGNSIYAGGWNTTQVPWSPCDLSHRWPGSDGDNARRLQRAIKSTQSNGALTANKMWYFFQQLATGGGGGGGGKKLALYHGGNMVGATSCCFLVPSLNQAVVVLCNTRGFYLDAANITCMFLADALARKVTDPRAIKNLYSSLDTIIRHIKGSYIRDLVLYETKLEEEYPLVASVDDFAGCLGKFQLVEGVFAVINGSHRGVLKFQLYGQGFKYSLRVKHDSSARASEVTMTFTMPMRDLVPHGVGGNNRLDIRDFELVFRGREQNGGSFGEFVWVFDRSGAPADGVVSAFVWRRVE
ncbi:beta-lactamase/transpeptidase-like protein [Apiosordaria backusii]|uniref:Beta-lactamase/transpeptidase-like protein n=1 Tax=Apiosordaria backusii TaxID=314023 RepID=A0AA40K3C7_9PEZI|nr:beta-lactamase/transpeptidase-like protein [Apiosordaria backusii]